MKASAQAEALLRDGLQRLGVPKPDAALPRLLQFGRLLLGAKQATNLTGARNLGRLVTAHFLDSLAPLGLIQLRDPIVDVGSGGGFPGIPCAIVYADHKIVLLEPRAKRASFLQSAAESLGLHNVSVVRSSSGGPGAANLIGGAGTVLMRAVTQPGAAFRLGLPLLKPGGALLLYEGRKSEPTPQERGIAHQLGGRGLTVKPVSVPHLEERRHAWIVHKGLEPANAQWRRKAFR